MPRRSSRIKRWLIFEDLCCVDSSVRCRFARLCYLQLSLYLFPLILNNPNHSALGFLLRLMFLTSSLQIGIFFFLTIIIIIIFLSIWRIRVQFRMFWLCFLVKKQMCCEFWLLASFYWFDFRILFNLFGGTMILRRYISS